MSTAPTQTKAQRLADELVARNNGDLDWKSAAILRRQDELLKKALCVLERVHHTTDTDRAVAADAIRKHLEAK